MKKIILICLLICVKVSTFAQNLEDYTGVYFVEQICSYTSDYLPANDTAELFFTTDTAFNQLKVTIAKNDTIDLEINAFSIPNTLGVNLVNDNIFQIKDQTVSNSYRELLVGGDVLFSNDSIYLNLFLGSLSPIYTGACKSSGQKIRDIEVGITEIGLLNNTVYFSPNPVKYKLQVHLPTLDNKIYNNYFIFNTNGSQILRGSSNSYQSISVSDLPNGTYFIHFLKDEVSIASGRFVKME